jgi:dTDP-glucose 4,6-dehydratase
MQPPGMNVIVTGGAGFTGSHLMKALLAEGAEVTALDNSCQGSPGNLATSLVGIEHLRADVLAPRCNMQSRRVNST